MSLVRPLEELACRSDILSWFSGNRGRGGKPTSQVDFLPIRAFFFFEKEGHTPRCNGQYEGLGSFDPSSLPCSKGKMAWPAGTGTVPPGWAVQTMPPGPFGMILMPPEGGPRS